MPICIHHESLSDYLGLSLWPKIDPVRLPFLVGELLRFVGDLPNCGNPVYHPTFTQWEGALSRLIADHCTALSRRDVERVLFTVCGIRFTDPENPGVVTVPARLHAHGKGQPTKLGRALRRFLTFDDSLLESVLQSFLELHHPARRMSAFQYRLESGQQAFQTAYLAPVLKGLSGSAFNCLHGSCMQRQSKCYGGKHPARAYARDFEIATAWRGDDIAARVIVAKDREAATPVYAAGDAAGRALTDWLAQEHGITLGDLTDDLSGYRLAAIEVNGGYLMPYLDCRENVEFDGESWYIGSRDGQETDTGGIIYDEPQGYCDECEDNVDEDSLTYVESVGHCVCESCLSGGFTQSDISGDYFRDYDVVTYLGRRCREYKAGPDETDSLCFSEYHDSYILDDFAIYIVSIEDYIHVDDETDEVDGETFLVDSVEYRDAIAGIEPTSIPPAIPRIDDPDQLDFDAALAEQFVSV